MTRADFVAALQAAGGNHLAVADLRRYVDEACAEFGAEENWPWRYTRIYEAPPATASGMLGPIKAVNQSNIPIFPRTHGDLLDAGVDLSLVGTPSFYYVLGGGVFTYPVTVGVVEIDHYSRKCWTTGGEAAGSDADLPLCNRRWDDAILLLARMRCLSVDRDWDALKTVRAEYDLRLVQARETELYDMATEGRPRAAA